MTKDKKQRARMNLSESFLSIEEDAKQTSGTAEKDESSVKKQNNVASRVALNTMAILFLAFGLILFYWHFDRLIEGQVIERYQKFSALSDGIGREAEISLALTFEAAFIASIALLFLYSSIVLFRGKKGAQLTTILTLLLLVIAPFVSQSILNLSLERPITFKYDTHHSAFRYLFLALVGIFLLLSNSIKSNLQRKNKFVVIKYLMVATFSFVIFFIGIGASGYIDEGEGLEHHKASKPYQLEHEVSSINLKNGELVTDGVWGMGIPIGGEVVNQTFYQSKIAIKSDLINQGNNYCRMLATERPSGNDFVKRYRLVGDYSEQPSLREILTNCNDAGSMFVKSDGLQSLIVFDEKYLFVTYRYKGEEFVAQLTKQRLNQSFSSEFNAVIENSGRM